jgi:hypothetical protein
VQKWDPFKMLSVCAVKPSYGPLTAAQRAVVKKHHTRSSRRALKSMLYVLLLSLLLLLLLPLAPFYSKDARGTLHLNFHDGQARAWESGKRIVCMLAGAQSGKTVFGPVWLAREIQRRGPGDYLVVAPTYKLLSLKCFPEFMKLYKSICGWGDFTAAGGFRHRFLFSPAGCKSLFGYAPLEPTQVFMAHAQDPDALESATAKAAWLDEAGQKKFRFGSWEAVQRRLAIHQGRILISTTPYTLGWLQDEVWDPWEQSGGDHPYIDVVNFESTANPAFPKEEFERARANLYRGRFQRPAGVIYPDFDTRTHIVDPFLIPLPWPRYIGLDFGGVHTAAVFLAAELDAKLVPTGRWYVYREYPYCGRWVSATAKGHAVAIKSGERQFRRVVGGSASEEQWRAEFTAAGLTVLEPPVSEVEVGIDRVSAAVKQGKLLVFRNCKGTIDDIRRYSRELDDRHNPTEKIDGKAEFHYCDALRYIVSWLNGAAAPAFVR